jgi:hypothetical protein
MKRSRAFPLVLAAGSALAAACTETPTTSPRPSGSSSTSSGSSSGGTEEPAYILDDGSGTGTTFSALYADLFGPSGRASCAGTGSACHASEDAAGAIAKFVCATEDGCKTSMLGESRLVRADSDPAQPGSALLVKALRRKDADGEVIGRQPKSPLFVFHDRSLERIKAWIADGAK